jgi:putative flippase GtrA
MLAEIARFETVGVANTLVGLAVIYGGMLGGLAEVPANALGYLTGLLLGFLLNRRWTFGWRGATLHALGRYALSFAVAYSVNLTCLLILTGSLHVDSYVAQALSVVFYTATFYSLSRVWVFRNVA